MANRITQYFVEARQELAKVSWPTRKHTVRQSMFVLAICFATAIFLGGLDYLLSIGLQNILR